jgi:hypothetical protein
VASTGPPAINNPVQLRKSGPYMHALYSYPQNRFDFGRGIFYRFGQMAASRPDRAWICGIAAMDFQVLTSEDV